MRIVPRSIQGRMLALSGVATLVALAIAGVLIAGVLARFVTQGIDRRLDAQLALLASAVGSDGSVDRDRLAAVSAALEAGPDWLWRVETPRGGFGSRDLAALAPPPPAPAPGPGPTPPPAPRPPAPRPPAPRPPGAHRGEHGYGLHARALTIPTRVGPVRLIAAAPQDVIARPVEEALLPLLLTLAALGAVIGLAAVIQIRLGLRPVRRLRDAVGAVRTGRARGVPTDQPVELEPLAEELNALIADNAAALAGARASAANLAHGLKTPVATLALALRGDPRAAQVDRIDATIRHHLARARGHAPATRAATPLAPAIAALAETVALLRAERGVGIEAAIPPDLRVAIDPADLDELAGNLIDNAMRHAARHVAVVATIEARRARLTVTDDGPGIAAEDRARATAPGVRLDERSDGHGFGLAIARELAELHGGTLALDEAPRGGLAASVTLPLAAAPGQPD